MSSKSKCGYMEIRWKLQEWFWLRQSKIYSNLNSVTKGKMFPWQNSPPSLGQQTHFSDRSRFWPPPQKSYTIWELAKYFIAKIEDPEFHVFVLMKLNTIYWNFTNVLNMYYELVWSIINYWSHELGEKNPMSPSEL